ncbi:MULTISPECIES: DUF7940 domain-containing protein [unclassified Halomonas]|uniref:DUF7940 domain-containing protein n=1 Tax=unclassified Halomonas TaxID=2609666 RepID=UPI0009907A5A|nr:MULTISPECIES: hypothetical protein [unclassified Halomonas]AQU83235.1 hypothetical protein B2G49_12065 [Halomonas sp. 'Soap Lake \
MRLIDDAHNWHRLWSVRLSLAATVFGTLEAVLPLWEVALPQGMFALLAAGAATGASVARAIKQHLP